MIFRVALHGRAVTGFGQLELALLKINIAELRIMMGLIEMMNLCLESFDQTAVMGAGQFKAARGGRRAAIHDEEIKGGGQCGAKEDDDCPDPFAFEDGVHEHPEPENAKDQGEG